MRRPGRAAAVVTAVLVLAAGCGEGVEPTGPTGPTEPATPELPEVTAGGTVLENARHGPELCFFVDASYPPQCGGIELRGWNWAAVPGAEQVGAVRWADSVEVAGVYDPAGEVLTLTRPPRIVSEEERQARYRPFFPIVCPAPAGGWPDGPAPDPAVEAYALAQPDLSGFWVGRDGVDPAGTRPPAASVTHVRFTGDVERHRAAVEAVAQGAVCVLEGGVPRSAVKAAALELSPTPANPTSRQNPVIFTLTDEAAGHVLAFVTFDDGALQRAYDERFGTGVIQVVPQLELVDQ